MATQPAMRWSDGQIDETLAAGCKPVDGVEMVPLRYARGCLQTMRTDYEAELANLRRQVGQLQQHLRLLQDEVT